MRVASAFRPIIPNDPQQNLPATPFKDCSSTEGRRSGQEAAPPAEGRSPSRRNVQIGVGLVPARLLPSPSVSTGSVESGRHSKQRRVRYDQLAGSWTQRESWQLATDLLESDGPWRLSELVKALCEMFDRNFALAFFCCVTIEIIVCLSLSSPSTTNTTIYNNYKITRSLVSDCFPPMAKGKVYSMTGLSVCVLFSYLRTNEDLVGVKKERKGEVCL